MDTRGRLREAFDAAVPDELRHFLRHVLLVLYQDVLVLEIELSKFEIQHFHHFFEVIIASLHDFLRLWKPELDDVELVGEQVKSDYKELALDDRHLDDTLNMVPSNHAEISPQDFAPLIE